MSSAAVNVSGAAAIDLAQLAQTTTALEGSFALVERASGLTADAKFQLRKAILLSVVAD
jgi:hypothetical protein